MFLRLKILTFAIKNKNTLMKQDYFFKTAETEHVIFSIQRKKFNVNSEI